MYQQISGLLGCRGDRVVYCQNLKDQLINYAFKSSRLRLYNFIDVTLAERFSEV
jgi:hypothetical protein